MEAFRDQPIRRKLLLIILATIAASLVLVMAGIVAYELATYRDRLSKEVGVVAAFIAANSAPSLAFDDPETAREMLFTLGAYPEVAIGALYTSDGRLFAFFAPGRTSTVAPPAPPAEGTRFAGRQLEIIRPIEQRGRRLGTLYLRAETAALSSRLAPYAGILVVSALAIGGGAFLLQRMLERLVSEPLLRLSKTAEKIADGDLEARAPIESEDEIGQLAGAFNRMTAELAQSYAVLAKREMDYRTLAENSPEVIARFDRQLRHTYINEYGAQVYGMPKEDIIGRTSADLGMPAETAGFWEMHFEAVFAGREQRTVEFEFDSPEFGRQSFSSLFVPEFGEGGEVVSILAITRDITALKRTEAELRRLTGELEQRVEERTAELTVSNRELEAFTYSVSHDLRAPLRHITGFVELLAADAGPALDEQGRRYMGIIADAARRMTALIDDLLTFSRIGRATMTESTVDLGTIVNEARRELEPETAGREIDWRIGPLPQVRGDPTLLRTVMVNLLANAVKFTRQRSPARSEVGSREENGEVVCFVRDNGAGFDMSFADKLFGVFQRLHRPQEFEGTGIGLASVRRIIQRHGGRTWGEGEVGQGATFFFSLPTQRKHVQA
jgi:PAS domain S-box-containing protein